MPVIIYVESNGTEHSIDVEEKMNLMEGATINMVPGIDGVCGGICSCCTCHVYIEGEWASKLPAPTAGETSMLKNAKHLRPTSRLGCQVNIEADMEGMRVLIPAEQGQNID